ncbi:uncharacterized protein LOC132475619 isoform X4 [Gadus macrocephalus]|uniref:uncharacterized protein LOC132475619 isoform X4 n=1 Tax=Gadus macrocephalus TaxID=80720 RepID=UPI0028CBB4B1|nr:uncharacterized protein LOC132475619 isoform X4 [Gadus macrocephalus]
MFRFCDEVFTSENGPRTKGWATMTPTPPYTPANLLAIETLLQFKQVDCEFALTDIQAAPANRMTRAVLSILVMFVCLAPMLEVNSTTDDFKMVIEGVELYINSLKEEDLEMVANGLIDEQIHIANNMLNVIQFIGPEFAAVKKLFEAVMVIIPELKAKWLKSPEDYKHFWEYIHKAIEGLKVLHEIMLIKDEL